MGLGQDGAVATAAAEATSDEELMCLVAEGNEDAFRALVNANGPRLMAVATAVLRDRAFAEDIVQEVFTAVWTAPGAFRPGRGSVRAWLAAMTHHRAVDRVRRETSQRDRVARLEMMRPAEMDDPASVVPDAIDAHQDAMRVRAAIDALPPTQRAVIVRMYFQGRSGRQIPEELGLPLGTVKSRALLAMRKLRAELAASVTPVA
jgi:RNA polymerase sigma-70 factor (ECF subfamily)